MSIEIATADDAATLAALKRETFSETFLAEGFAIPYPPADLARFVADNYGPARVAVELVDPTRCTWIARSAAGDPIGYAQVGPCKLPHPDVLPAHGELYQLYVRRSAQGSGVGRALFAGALDHLAATRPGPVWLGVWSGNHKAQAFYEAAGFAPVGTYDFMVGDWADAEIIYRR